MLRPGLRMDGTANGPQQAGSPSLLRQSSRDGTKREPERHPPSAPTLFERRRQASGQPLLCITTKGHDKVKPFGINNVRVPEGQYNNETQSPSAEQVIPLADGDEDNEGDVAFSWTAETNAAKPAEKT